VEKPFLVASAFTVSAHCYFQASSGVKPAYVKMANCQSFPQPPVKESAFKVTAEFFYPLQSFRVVRNLL